MGNINGYISRDPLDKRGRFVRVRDNFRVFMSVSVSTITKSSVSESVSINKRKS